LFYNIYTNQTNQVAVIVTVVSSYKLVSVQVTIKSLYKPVYTAQPAYAHLTD